MLNCRTGRSLIVVLALIALFTLAGCGSKINRENYDKIKTDMSQSEVIDILGEPTETESITLGGLSGTSSVWKDEKATIAIKFFNKKVKTKNYTVEE